MKDLAFDYPSAFSRNIGWVTPAEQVKLSGARVAIGGLGGVGGAHLLTLTRLGVGSFSISDFDRFEIQNFNRQAGALCSSLGDPKIDTLARMANDINPHLDLRCFSDGINDSNLDKFLEGVDVYVDGIDFFAIDIRRKIFDACAKKNIPAVTAAPLGMGVALLYFQPGAMTFEDYFQLDGQPQFEQFVRFIAGLSPGMLQRNYLVVESAVNFLEKRGPSTIMACDLCAGVMGAEVLKILLKRGRQLAAPWGLQFDSYRQKLVTTWRPGGNRNPLQKLLMALIRKKLKG